MRRNESCHYSRTALRRMSNRTSASSTINQALSFLRGTAPVLTLIGRPRLPGDTIRYTPPAFDSAIRPSVAPNNKARCFSSNNANSPVATPRQTGIPMTHAAQLWQNRHSHAEHTKLPSVFFISMRALHSGQVPKLCSAMIVEITRPNATSQRANVNFGDAPD